MQRHSHRQQPVREIARPSARRRSSPRRASPSMYQELMQRRRSAAPANRQELELEREQEQQQQAQRQQESTATSARGIRLESALRLEHERQRVRRHTAAPPPFVRHTTRRRAATTTAVLTPSETEYESERHGTSRACGTTDGSGTQHTQTTTQSTASSTDSILSTSTRDLLHQRAVAISHALVRRAHDTIKSVTRSDAAARHERGMDADGFRFVRTSKTGVTVYEDATAIRLEQRHQTTRPRFVAITAVKATLDEFVDAFGGRSNDSRGFQQLHPDVTTCQQVQTLVDAPSQRIGVKRLGLQPTSLGARARRRDFVVLACDELFEALSSTTTDSTVKRRGYVQVMHSVQLPSCPSLETTASNIVRGSMYQTGLVVFESERSREWLQVVAVVDLDLKGAMAMRTQRTNALRWLAPLDTVASTLVQRRLERLALLRTASADVIKRPKATHCAVCTQRIGLPSLRRRYDCHQCNASVCSSCSRSWTLESTTCKTTRMCGRCISAVDANRLISRSDNTVAPVIDGVTHRVLSTHDHRGYKGPPSTPHKVSLGSTAAATTAPPRVSRYFDLPMDPRELDIDIVSDEDDDDSGCTGTIYPLCDARAATVEAYQPSAKLHAMALACERRGPTKVGAPNACTSASLTESDDAGEDKGYSSLASRARSSRRSLYAHRNAEASRSSSNVVRHHQQQQSYKCEQAVDL